MVRSVPSILAIDSTQSFHYHLYGHDFRSNVLLPGAVQVIPGPVPNEIVLHLGLSPEPVLASDRSASTVIYTSSDRDLAGEPLLRILRLSPTGFLQVAYSDGMQFWINATRDNVWATWPADSSLESTLSTLLGPIVGLLFRLRGITCLHASAVALAGCAVAFLGAAGSGKSTTAAAFAREGCGVLADDITVLADFNGAFHVAPGYPRICLWPPAVEMLFGTADALPKIIPDDEKRLLALGGKDAPLETRSLPLVAIYVLGERRPDAPPSFEPLRGHPALISLVADTFANKVLDREMRAHEFDVLTTLVEKVPVRKVHAHSDPSRITEFCRMIRQDVAAIRQSG